MSVETAGRPSSSASRARARRRRGTPAWQLALAGAALFSATAGTIYWLAARPGAHAPVAAVPPTFGRLFEGTEVACAGQTAPERATRTTVPTGLPTCWHPAGNLLASPQSTER